MTELSVPRVPYCGALPIGSQSPALIKHSEFGIVYFKAPAWSTTKPANPPLYRTPPSAATTITAEFKTTRFAANYLSGGAGKLLVGCLVVAISNSCVLA